MVCDIAAALLLLLAAAADWNGGVEQTLKSQV